MEIAEHLERRGVTPVWSAGPGEEPIVQSIDAGARFRSVAGRRDLAQLWHLIARARVLVAPDTGVAHLARAAFTPSVTLYGPGSAVLCGPGEFWRGVPQVALTVDPFECRDQTLLFRRDVHWVRRCTRGLAECAAPRCMEAIEATRVVAAVEAMLAARS
jgi:ADP-heptose:LPS heptosyltransferase